MLRSCSLTLTSQVPPDVARHRFDDWCCRWYFQSRGTGRDLGEQIFSSELQEQEKEILDKFRRMLIGIGSIFVVVGGIALPASEGRRYNFHLISRRCLTPANKFRGMLLDIGSMIGVVTVAFPF